MEGESSGQKGFGSVAGLPVVVGAGKFVKAVEAYFLFGREGFASADQAAFGEEEFSQIVYGNGYVHFFNGFLAESKRRLQGSGFLGHFSQTGEDLLHGKSPV